MTDLINGTALAVADLSDVMPQSSGVLHIVVPGTNKRTGWQITFAGPGHPKTVAQNEELARTNLDKQERIEMAQVNNRKWKGDGRQPSDVRAENVDWVLGRILSWKAVVRTGEPPTDIELAGPTIRQFSDKPIELPEDASPEQIKQARALLGQPYMQPYFLQMTEYLGDQASFIAASART
jgi:hypothetical protein